MCVCVLVELCLCECLLSQPHAPSFKKTTCLSNPTADEILKERGGWGGGCQKSKTGEIYSNGR